MTKPVAAKGIRSDTAGSWVWPLNLGRYRRHGWLSDEESGGLRMLGFDGLRFDQDRSSQQWQAIRRLTRPLDDAQSVLHWHPDNRHQRRFAHDAAAIALHHCAELGRAYWSWTAPEWATLMDPEHLRDFFPGQVGPSARPYLLAYAYLLAGFASFELAGKFSRQSLARKVFGLDAVDHAIKPVREVLAGWGYRANELMPLVCGLLLLNRSPRVGDLSSETLARLRNSPAMQHHHHVGHLHGVHRALAALGHTGPPPAPKYSDGPVPITGTDAAWAHWVERWHATSTLAPPTRDTYRVVLAKIGRWLATEHPGVTEPQQWTRQTCAAWIAAIDRMTIGDHIQSPVWLGGRQGKLGKPLSPKTKRTYLRIARTFLRDCQDLEWIERRFDPARTLATPRSIKALQGPDPRVIADDIWAKLLWAGLNIDGSDLPSGCAHPLEMVRAMTVTWLFSGQRSDEIARLRVGCIRWQRDQPPANKVAAQPKDAICLLDIPAHKTGTAFTKPVDPLLGQAIEAWQTTRPAQPAMLDRKQESKCISCSPSALKGSARTTSTKRSSPCSAAKPASPPSTFAAPSQATGADPRSRRSSTTPRSQ